MATADVDITDLLPPDSPDILCDRAMGSIDGTLGQIGGRLANMQQQWGNLKAAARDLNSDDLLELLQSLQEDVAPIVAALDTFSAKAMRIASVVFSRREDARRRAQSLPIRDLIGH